MTRGRWLHVVLGGLALLLAGLSIAGSEHNRRAVIALEADRAGLARAQQIARVNDALVQLLARTAAERDDPALRALLAANGVTFKVDGTPP